MTNTTLPTIAVNEPDPRSDRLRNIVIELVSAGAFREPRDVLNGYLKEFEARNVRHIETVFAKWSALPKDDRPDFLTYAHNRRNRSLEVSGA